MNTKYSILYALGALALADFALRSPIKKADLVRMRALGYRRLPRRADGTRPKVWRRHLPNARGYWEISIDGIVVLCSFTTKGWTLGVNYISAKSALDAKVDLVTGLQYGVWMAQPRRFALTLAWTAFLALGWVLLGVDLFFRHGLS